MFFNIDYQSLDEALRLDVAPENGQIVDGGAEFFVGLG